MRRVTYRLTRSVDATVLISEPDADQPPKVVAVVIRPRPGSGGDVSVFAVQQLTAEMLRGGPGLGENNDGSEFDLIVEGDPWTELRAELLDSASAFPDFAPSEFDTGNATQLLNHLTTAINKLREEIQIIQERLDSIDSEAALGYTVPTLPALDFDRLRATLEENSRSAAESGQEPGPVQPEGRLVVSASHLDLGDLATANLTFNRRTGLWVASSNGGDVIALPKRDGVEPRRDPQDFLLFDVTRRPTGERDLPDFILRNQDGSRVDVRVKSFLRHTVALRPRQMSAAIAALEARQRGDYVAGRYKTTAQELGIPAEKPIIVQRLIASVMRLISEPTTEMLVRFLAPKEVNIDKVIKQVQDGGAPVTDKKKSRRKRT